MYLYIKQHRITKLKYFGKTTQLNPEKYKGSGTRWLNHLKKHGNRVDTLCLWEFDIEDECREFALKFSLENNIVKSKEWANLIDENISGRTSDSMKGSNNPMFGKSRPDTIKRNLENNPSQFITEKTRKLWSQQRTGEGNPSYGKPRPDLIERNKAGKGKSLSTEHKQKLIKYPVPEDFLQKSQELTLTQITKHYNIIYKVAYRWKKDSGLPVPNSIIFRKA